MRVASGGQAVETTLQQLAAPGFVIVKAITEARLEAIAALGEDGAAVGCQG